MHIKAQLLIQMSKGNKSKMYATLVILKDQEFTQYVHLSVIYLFYCRHLLPHSS